MTTVRRLGLWLGPVLLLATAVVSPVGAGAQAPPEGDVFIVSVADPAAAEAVAVAVARSGGTADVLDQVGSVVVDSIETATELAAIDGVVAVQPDRVARRAIDQSAAMTGAPALWQHGVVGNGRAVVVIDDGVDRTHPALASSVSIGACFTDGQCGSGTSRATGVGAGDPCVGCRHGTEVAGIVTSSASPYRGIADGAAVVPMRVFGSSTGTARESDLIRALDHTLTLAGTQPIDAVNISLTFTSPGRFASDCDGTFPAFATAVDRLAGVGIVTVVASGNGSSTEGVEAPACLRNALSVGALDAAGGQVAGFSNRGPNLDLVAPGSSIATTVPGGSFASGSGTSFAAPHVTAAIALLRQIEPTLGIGEIRRLLDGEGATAPDAAGARYPRLSLDPLTAGLDLGLLVPGVRTLQPATMRLVGNFTSQPGEELFLYTPGAGPDHLVSLSARGESDHRSINISGTYAPFIGDFDGNGFDDIFWYAPGGAADSIWYMTGDVDHPIVSIGRSINGAYRPFVGDFTGDGFDDVFWYAPGSAADSMWSGRANGTFVSSTFNVNDLYTPIVVDLYSDIAGDEIIWWTNAGPDSVWEFPTSSTVRSTAVTVPAAHRGVVGDYDGDGSQDVLWLGPGAAPDGMFWGARGRNIASAPLSIQGSYLGLAADFDGDGVDGVVLSGAGSADYFWRFVERRPVSTALRFTEAVDPVVIDLGRGPRLDLLFDAAGSTDVVMTSLGAPATWG